MSYRNDPRRQAARATYIADHADVDPTDAFVRRVLATVEMFTIESAPSAEAVA